MSDNRIIPHSERIVTPEMAFEALDAHTNQINGEFNKRPRFVRSIPVQDDDSDIVLSDYIIQTARLARELEEARREIRGAYRMMDEGENWKAWKRTPAVRAALADGEKGGPDASEA